MYRSNIWELFVEYTEKGQIVSDIDLVIVSSIMRIVSYNLCWAQGISSSPSGSLGKAEIMYFSLILLFSVKKSSLCYPHSSITGRLKIHFHLHNNSWFLSTRVNVNSVSTRGFLHQPRESSLSQLVLIAASVLNI